MPPLWRVPAHWRETHSFLYSSRESILTAGRTCILRGLEDGVRPSSGVPGTAPSPRPHRHCRSPGLSRPPIFCWNDIAYVAIAGSGTSAVLSQIEKGCTLPPQQFSTPFQRRKETDLLACGQRKTSNEKGSASLGKQALFLRLAGPEPSAFWSANERSTRKPKPASKYDP